jgi:hypothetical protein
MISDTTAKSTWQLFQLGIDTNVNKGKRSAAFVADEYVKERGGWKIRNIKYVHVFREEFDRDGITLLQ